MQDVEIAIVAGGDPSDTADLAEEFAIPDWTLDLDDALEHRDVEAVLLATPTPLHASQALRCLDAGKHILVEIPMAETLEDSESIVAKQRETGLVAMVCHTRRFNPGHVWIHERIASGQLKLHHLVAETLFFRYQTGRLIAEVWSQQGPAHPDLGIAMDMTVALRDDQGVLCSLAMSFNNDGPLGTWFRYICDKGTYVARYDELVDGWNDPIDLGGVEGPSDGIERQNREFFDAIAQGREPNASVGQALETMKVLDWIDSTMTRP
jgi:2-hydroxy-4-carboxymuconate semialdehyde hemiacetal dehydrogenase